MDAEGKLHRTVLFIIVAEPKIDKSSPLKSSRPRSLALGLLRGPGEKRSLKHLQAPGIYSHSLAWVVNVIKKDEGKPINCIRCFKKGLLRLLFYRILASSIHKGQNHLNYFESFIHR